MRLLICFACLLILASTADAQYCNPASVSLLLRDKSGAALSKDDVTAIAALLPKTISDADVWVGEASLADDGKNFYWQDSTDWDKGKKIPALMFSNVATCTMKLTEVTVEFGGQKMRLIFDINIERSTQDRRPVIYAPHFKAGAFKLDLTGWTHEPETIIGDKWWKPVESNK